jgi:signal peptidase II
MSLRPNHRMALIAFSVFALDQLTKEAVLKYLGYAQERIIINGFFKLVHWHNTGAAWSLFYGKNPMLAIISLMALLGLFLWRHHFDTKTILGQISLGLIFGGILGNLFDRLHPDRQHVIDFIRFYVERRSGSEVGFPAFNVADSAICVGVGLMFLLSWRNEAESTVNT